MGEFMIGIFNTSIVVGVCIVVLHIFFFFCRDSYSAKCRKVIWVLTAFCLLVPFQLFTAPRAYTAEIPDMVLKEMVHVRTSHERGDAEQLALADVSGLDLSPDVSRVEITVTDVAFLLWVCIGILMASYYMVGYWRMKRKIKRWGKECDDESTRTLLTEVSNQYGLKRIPGLCVLQDSLAGPFTTGVLKSVVVLPDEAISERDLGFIMKHEILHCRNKDILWKLLFLVVNIIHWFNPLVWMLRKTAEQDMEIACDEEITFHKTKEYRQEYSDVIMSWATKEQYKGSALSTGYVRGVSFLKRRFASIFNSKRKKNGILLVGATCVFIMLVGTVIQIRKKADTYTWEEVDGTQWEFSEETGCLIAREGTEETVVYDPEQTYLCDVEKAGDPGYVMISYLGYGYDLRGQTIYVEDGKGGFTTMSCQDKETFQSYYQAVNQLRLAEGRTLVREDGRMLELLYAIFDYCQDDISFDGQKYDKIIDLCQLTDWEMLLAGDVIRYSGESMVYADMLLSADAQ